MEASGMKRTFIRPSVDRSASAPSRLMTVETSSPSSANTFLTRPLTGEVTVSEAFLPLSDFTTCS